jgi:hypothetical protein
MNYQRIFELARDKSTRAHFQIRMNRQLSLELMNQAKREGKTASEVLSELTIDYLQRRLEASSEEASLEELTLAA